MSKEPLYPRVLRLRHVHPTGWQRLLFWEGSFVVALLIVGADLASLWLVVVLPLAVAAVVKAHDVLAGLLHPGDSGGAAEETARTGIQRVPLAEPPPTGNVRTRTPTQLPTLADLHESHTADWSAEVTKDLESVTELGLRLAHQLLEREGGFLPFAAVLTTAGSREATTVDLGIEEVDPGDVLDALHADLRSRRDALRAVAVLADAQPAPDESGQGSGDVILVELGHDSGPSVLLVTPYSLKDGVVRFGTVSGLASGSGVWSEEPAGAD